MDDRSTDDRASDDGAWENRDDRDPGDGVGDTDSDRHVAAEGDHWRFSLEELDQEPADRITPGSVSLEHAVFLLLGVATTAFVIAQLVL